MCDWPSPNEFAVIFSLREKSPAVRGQGEGGVDVYSETTLRHFPGQGKEAEQMAGRVKT